MTDFKYPYEPEGRPVSQIELEAVQDVAFQDPEDKGLWHRLVGVRRIGEYIASHLKFADKLGDVHDMGEVIFDVDDSEQGTIEEGTKITFREVTQDKKGKIIVGAVVATSIVGIGTLRAVSKKRNNT